METIGVYTVREIQGELLIKAPPGCSGKYSLVMNNDGSFTHYPQDGQGIPKSKKIQWVVSNSDMEDVVTFTEERRAVEYKEMMERNQGKVFRMKKVFPSSGIKTLGEEIF